MTERGRRWCVLAGILLCVGIVVSKAWVTDDAYISFRTAQNLVEGRGLTWNPDERVQVYTHPLWLFLAAAGYAVSGEFYYTSLALNLALTLAVLCLLAFRLASSWRAACVGLLLLSVSRAFTDYSTSGLENPLGHLLLVLLLLQDHGPERRGEVFRFSLLASLCLLTRPDLLFLVLPPWIATLWRHRGGRAIVAALGGVLPLLAWEAFSLLYYGALLPNTAYAKLNTGIPASELAAQGLRYLLNSLINDPPTLVAIVAVAVWVLVDPVSRAARAWGAGILLSLVYVVRVGGDFMSGRFLTPALVVATALLVSRSVRPRLAWAAAAAALALFAFPWTTPFVDRNYGGNWDAAIDVNGIADERAFYGERADLWSSWRLRKKWPDPKSFEEARWLHRHWPQDWFADDLLYVGTLTPQEHWPPPTPYAPDGTPYRMVIVRGAIGFLGYHLGPDVHVLDYHAIADPLLSRLPMTRPDPILAGLLPKQAARGWRVGHYYRRPPVGYVRTLATGENVIQDENLRRYYDVIRRITRDPLFDLERLETLVRFQLGAYDHLLTRDQRGSTSARISTVPSGNKPRFSRREGISPRIPDSYGPAPPPKVTNVTDGARVGG